MKTNILGLAIVILILMVGRLILTVSVAGTARESCAAAAAQVFSKVQQQGRLMKVFIGGLAGAILILIAGSVSAPMICGSSTSPPAGDTASPRGSSIVGGGRCDGQGVQR